MNAADRSRKTDELIGESEALRNELLSEVEKLESFVVALDQAVVQAAERRRRHAGDHQAH
jgi:formate-dependent phosphoribosylglycinamide formyltransferase (GAR transformylase)